MKEVLSRFGLVAKVNPLASFNRICSELSCLCISSGVLRLLFSVMSSKLYLLLYQPFIDILCIPNVLLFVICFLFSV